MATVQVEGIEGLKALQGKTIGPTDWREVTQDDINTFADLSGDDQWIHVDVERAKRELPGGKTIAHGYLTLSLLPRMMPELLKVTKRSRGVNYGSNKVRFVTPVPAGARVRLRSTLKAVDPVEGNGVRLTFESVIEVEGKDRPAMVAETLGIQYA